jgi:hypothetical protein
MTQRGSSVRTRLPEPGECSATSHFTIETANNLADARQSLKEREPSPQYDYHSTDGSHWVKNASTVRAVHMLLRLVNSGYSDPFKASYSFR